MINSTLASFAGAFANQLLVRYGTDAVAAMGAAGKSTLIISMIQMGLCMGVQPLMAYSYGAKNMPRIKEVLAKLSILTVTTGLSVTIFCLFNSRMVISLFLNSHASHCSTIYESREFRRCTQTARACGLAHSCLAK